MSFVLNSLKPSCYRTV